MRTKYFSLLELLKAREFLTAMMNSTRNFTYVEVSKEQLQKARMRLKEIDEELVNRLMGTEWQEPMFQNDE